MEELKLVIITILAISSISVCAPSSNKADTIIPLLGVPAECMEKSFCTVEPEGYVDIKPKLDVLLPEYLKQIYANDNTIRTNVILTTDHNDCVVETIDQPLMYKMSDGEWGIIVQTELFKQNLQIVRCAQSQHSKAGSGEECWSEYNLSQFGLKSSCVTTYATRTIYVYDSKKVKIIPKSLHVPVCCSCKIHFDL